MTNPVQAHIHLASSLGSGPEYAPIYTWKARDRSVKTVMQGRVVTSLSGYVYAHVVKRAATPVKRHDYKYDLIVRASGGSDAFDLYDRLEAMVGKHVYLVDHRHCADGADHTAYVQEVFFADLGEQRADVANLAFFYIPILLNGLTTTP